MKILRLLLPALFVLLILFIAIKNLIYRTPAILPSDTNNTKPTNTVTFPQQLQQSQGEVPSILFTLPSVFTVHTFAKNLSNPRDLTFSPGGTLFASIPSNNEIVALYDKNSDGVAENSKVIIKNLQHPHGLAFYNGKLFVAETTRVDRYSWNEDDLVATFEKKLFDLPANNNHNNRTLAFDSKGNLYVSVGSTCNVCIENSNLSATILISNAEGENLRIYAKGLRNAPFLSFKPNIDELWATEMGRDYLGDNLPPDEINIIKENADYGWPYCYGNKVHDNNFDNTNKHSCSNTIAPIFEIPAHSAPLGLTFINSKQFPSDWQNDLLVAYHGSWNRSIPTGYKIVHMKVNGNNITSAEDFMTGFANNGQTLARPVDLVFDKNGNLYISDDKSGNIFIIQKQ